jgi:hypothetical protein
MPFNNTAMVVAANALRAAATHGQLHSAAAGVSGTSNVTTAARKAITWSSATGAGDFNLSTQLDFTGGAASGTVHSITLWSASSGGTYYGEFPLSGDLAFNAGGSYSVTAIDFDGSAT